MSSIDKSQKETSSTTEADFHFSVFTDEYFLSNVKIIDDLTANKKARLMSTTRWPTRMTYSIETWPCYNLISNLGHTDLSCIPCIGCSQRGIAARIILYGQPYNPSTVTVVPTDNRIPYDKVRAEKQQTLCHLINAKSRFNLLPAGFVTMQHVFTSLRVVPQSVASKVSHVHRMRQASGREEQSRCIEKFHRDTKRAAGRRGMAVAGIDTLNRPRN